jgi:hypothetical protein
MGVRMLINQFFLRAGFVFICIVAFLVLQDAIVRQRGEACTERSWGEAGLPSLN